MEKSLEAFRTISEVADHLDTPAHVLRFWESRFPQIKPVKRAGGRRYYRPADVALLSGIRHLLHNEGMTIRGVQKILREQGVRHISSLAGEDIDADFDAVVALAETTKFDLSPPPPPAEVVDLQMWKATVPEAVIVPAEPALPAYKSDLPMAPAPVASAPPSAQFNLPFDLSPPQTKSPPLILSAPEPKWPAADIAALEQTTPAAPEAPTKAPAEAPQVEINTPVTATASPARTAAPPSQPEVDVAATQAADAETAQPVIAPHSETADESVATAPAQIPPPSPPPPETPWLPSRLRALPDAALASHIAELRPLYDRLTALRDRMAKAANRNRI